MNVNPSPGSLAQLWDDLCVCLTGKLESVAGLQATGGRARGTSAVGPSNVALPPRACAAMQAGQSVHARPALQQPGGERQPARGTPTAASPGRQRVARRRRRRHPRLTRNPLSALWFVTMPAREGGGEGGGGGADRVQTTVRSGAGTAQAPLWHPRQAGGACGACGEGDQALDPPCLCPPPSPHSPLCTTTNSWAGEETWGCALAGVGGPWVAQRVCAMPACASRAWLRSTCARVAGGAGTSLYIAWARPWVLAALPRRPCPHPSEQHPAQSEHRASAAAAQSSERFPAGPLNRPLRCAQPLCAHLALSKHSVRLTLQVSNLPAGLDD